MKRIFLLVFIFLLNMPITGLHASTDLNPEGALSSQNGSQASIVGTSEITKTISTADEIEKSSSLPQFDTSTYTSQLFWLAISFTILYIFFSKKTLPTISSTLESRKSTIKNDYAQADQLSAEAEEIKSAYELEIQKAKQAATAQLRQEEATFRQKTDAETKAFNDKAMQAVNEIESKVEDKKDAIKAELDVIVADLVSDITKKIANMDIDEKNILQAVQSELATSQPKQAKKAA